MESDRSYLVADAADSRQIPIHIKETGQVFPSGTQVAEYFNIGDSAIYDVIKQKPRRQTAVDGLHFTYATEHEKITDVMARKVLSLRGLQKLILQSDARVNVPYALLDSLNIKDEILIWSLIKEARQSSADLRIMRYPRGLTFKWRRRAT